MYCSLEGPPGHEVISLQKVDSILYFDCNGKLKRFLRRRNVIEVVPVRPCFRKNVRLHSLRFPPQAQQSASDVLLLRMVCLLLEFFTKLLHQPYKFVPSVNTVLTVVGAITTAFPVLPFRFSVWPVSFRTIQFEPSLSGKITV
jgi:hypothetical protein